MIGIYFINKQRCDFRLPEKKEQTHFYDFFSLFLSHFFLVPENWKSSWEWNILHSIDLLYKSMLFTSSHLSSSSSRLRGPSHFSSAGCSSFEISHTALCYPAIRATADTARCEFRLRWRNLDDSTLLWVCDDWVATPKHLEAHFLDFSGSRKSNRVEDNQIYAIKHRLFFSFLIKCLIGINIFFSFLFCEDFINN